MKISLRGLLIGCLAATVMMFTAACNNSYLDLGMAGPDNPADLPSGEVPENPETPKTPEEFNLLATNAAFSPELSKVLTKAFLNGMGLAEIAASGSVSKVVYVGKGDLPPGEPVIMCLSGMDWECLTNPSAGLGYNCNFNTYVCEKPCGGSITYSNAKDIFTNIWMEEPSGDFCSGLEGRVNPFSMEIEYFPELVRDGDCCVPPDQGPTPFEQIVNTVCMTSPLFAVNGEGIAGQAGCVDPDSGSFQAQLTFTNAPVGGYILNGSVMAFMRIQSVYPLKLSVSIYEGELSVTGGDIDSNGIEYILHRFVAIVEASVTETGYSILGIELGGMDISVDGEAQFCNDLACEALVEICNDERDNDYDELINCADSDCAEDPACICGEGGVPYADKVQEVYDYLMDPKEGFCEGYENAEECCMASPFEAPCCVIFGDGKDDCCPFMDSGLVREGDCCVLPPPPTCEFGSCASGPCTPGYMCNYETMCCELMPPVEICDNGKDDDGDRMTDCEDPDCSKDPACALPACTDISCDNKGSPDQTICDNAGCGLCTENKGEYYCADPAPPPPPPK